MTSPLSTVRSVNPFYFSRSKRREVPSLKPRPGPVFARLPLAPLNASPVPHLTSLYHFHRAGEYGSRSWPGNCGGNLIKDLLLYFQPANVFDPMTGSGTCRDVCDEIGVPCSSSDIHAGIDACDQSLFYGESARFPEASFEFVWLHPPYWRQKLYADDPRDLSRCETLEEFLERYRTLIRHSAHVLQPGGQLAILMGDYSDREAGFVPLTYFTKQLAFETGLVQCCTDIVRFSHGASSSRKVYRSSFIPGLHDLCMIFEKRK